MIEIIAGKNGPLADDTVARVLERLYRARHPARLVEAGAAGNAAAWEAIDARDRGARSECRGVVLLGLEAPEDDLVRQLCACRAQPSG